MAYALIEGIHSIFAPVVRPNELVPGPFKILPIDRLYKDAPNIYHCIDSIYIGQLHISDALVRKLLDPPHSQPKHSLRYIKTNGLHLLDQSCSRHDQTQRFKAYLGGVRSHTLLNTTQRRRLKRRLPL